MAHFLEGHSQGHDVTGPDGEGAGTSGQANHPGPGPDGGLAAVGLDRLGRQERRRRRRATGLRSLVLGRGRARPGRPQLGGGNSGGRPRQRDEGFADLFSLDAAGALLGR